MPPLEWRADCFSSQVPSVEAIPGNSCVRVGASGAPATNDATAAAASAAPGAGGGGGSSSGGGGSSASSGRDGGNDAVATRVAAREAEAARPLARTGARLKLGGEEYSVIAVLDRGAVGTAGGGLQLELDRPVSESAAEHAAEAALAPPLLPKGDVKVLDVGGGAHISPGLPSIATRAAGCDGTVLGTVADFSAYLKVCSFILAGGSRMIRLSKANMEA